MILTCPSCLSQFAINPAALGTAGRMVRCAKCKHTWLATAPLITLPDEPQKERVSSGIGAENAAGQNPGGLESMPAAAAHDDPEISARRLVKRRRAVIAGGVLALLLALPVLGWQVSRLTASGIAAPVLQQGGVPAKKGIVLDGTPTTRLFQEQGRNILKIEGQLTNTADDRRPVPKLRAQGLNARGQIVKEWDIRMNAEQLEPGQRLLFSFETPFAEQGVVDIAFHFM